MRGINDRPLDSFRRTANSNFHFLRLDVALLDVMVIREHHHLVIVRERRHFRRPVRVPGNVQPAVPGHM